jgi:hypothetical protein
VERKPPRKTRQTPIGIGENCFSLKDGPLKSPPNMPTIDQPEEVILASLQYTQGNDKLHVLIKPMLEQWEQLHDDPSCTPTKTKMKKTQSAGIADTGASVLCSATNLMRQLGQLVKPLRNSYSLTDATIYIDTSATD